MRKLPLEEVAKGIAPYVSGVTQLELLAETLQNHLNTFAEAQNYLPLFQGENAQPLDEEGKAVLAEETVPQVLDLFAEKMAALDDITPGGVKDALKAIRKETGLSGAKVFMPVRLALTGCQHGPDIDKLVALMGRDILNKRLAQARKN